MTSPHAASASSEAAISTPLSQWLRMLWNLAPPLRLDSESPYISAGVIHLPARSDWRLHTAAAAHAAAHLVYSPAGFDGAGLGPVARALVALLEDARVEALAARELPGLARLWRPLHTATVALGSGFEALMQRLARSLADPEYDDPDPWVRKGRTLFYLDASLGLLALRTSAEVRKAATLLGHDIGQMRLQFNARTYTPVPGYRDDHRWMWAADTAAVPAVAPSVLGAADVSGEATGDAVSAEAYGSTAWVSWYPEWDRLISRLRPAWVRVSEQPARLADVSPPDSDTHDQSPILQAGRRLQGPVRALTLGDAAACRSAEGEVFHLGALVDWRVARRLHRPPDVRVYRGHRRGRQHAAVCLLIDQSWSSAASGVRGGGSLLQLAAQAAAATALALQAAGVACVVMGFSSAGRQRVRLNTVKACAEPADGAMLARLQALRPGGSTRLGAALRHAARRLPAGSAGPRWVIVLSDGQAHDVDMHDPRYLVEDARHAVQAAARRGVRMVCLLLGRDPGTEAVRIFGRRGAHLLPDLRDLPRVIGRLTHNP